MAPLGLTDASIVHFVCLPIDTKEEEEKKLLRVILVWTEDSELELQDI